MSKWIHKLVACVAIMSVAALAIAGPKRMFIAEQHSWGKKQGFYIDIKGESIEKAAITVALGSGNKWNYLGLRPAFAVETDYTLKVVIGPNGSDASLSSGGKVISSSKKDVATKHMPGSIRLNYTPEWEKGAKGTWKLYVSHLKLWNGVDTSQKPTIDYDFSHLKPLPMPFGLFKKAGGGKKNSKLPAGDGTVVVEATFSFYEGSSKAHSPLVDVYGQLRAAKFANKVTDDAQLKADIAKEAERLKSYPIPADYDKYGGYLKSPWKAEGTGFFRTVKRNGVWWLISPEGNPTFYTGVCVAPALTWPSTPVTGREYMFEKLDELKKEYPAAYSYNPWGYTDGPNHFSHRAVNLIKKYGKDWRAKGESDAFNRIKRFGFSGGAKWGAPKGTAKAAVIWDRKTPKVAGHFYDPFDEKTKVALKDDFARQMKSGLNSPWIIGWSFGNEDYGIVQLDIIKKILAKKTAVPAKKALIDYAIDKLAQGDIAAGAKLLKVKGETREDVYKQTKFGYSPLTLEKLRQYFAHAYHELAYKTVKSIDSNHMYLSFWIVPNWWVNESDWKIAAAHTDMMTFDRYDRDFNSPLVLRLLKESGKPAICGEFGHPAHYDGMRGYSAYKKASGKDDAESGQLYYESIQKAASNPHMVGMMWFLYRDQPVLGRGPGKGSYVRYGENSAFGLITVTDRIKWDLVTRMREANLKAFDWHMKVK